MYVKLFENLENQFYCTLTATGNNQIDIISNVFKESIVINYIQSFISEYDLNLVVLLINNVITLLHY